MVNGLARSSVGASNSHPFFSGNSHFINGCVVSSSIGIEVNFLKSIVWF
eukprot:04665.XXX_181126_180666_1 [CDS] Oithona nana genome sequencing.